MIPFLDLLPSTGPSARRSRRPCSRRCAAANSSSAPASRASRRSSRAYCGAEQAIAVNTGTSALHLAFLAAGIGPGDEVITVPATFVATVAAILYASATPVFVDVDPATWTMDPAHARGGDHAAHQGDRAGAPARPPRRHGRDHAASRGATASSSSRTPARRTARARRPPRRRLRRHRLLQLLSGQEPRRLRRGRRDHHRATPRYAETMRSLRDWGQAGKYNHVRARLQLPHGRRPGRGPRRQAPASRRLERRGAGASRNAYDAGLAAGHRPRRRPDRRRPRLPRLRGPHRRPRRRCAPGSSTRASRRSSTTRRRSTCSPPTPTSARGEGSLPGQRGAGARDPVAAALSRARPTPRSPASIDAVNAIVAD